MNWFFLACLFLGSGAWAQVNSLGLRGPEIPPKKAGVYRILLLGPGLSHPGLDDANLPSALLAQNLNRDCAGCFEVINGSIEKYFSTRNLLLVEKIADQLQPDMIVYYESGAFFSADILERFHYNWDEETELPYLKTAADLYKNPCCDSVFNFLSEPLRRRLTLVLNYVALFKDAKTVQKRDLVTVSSDHLNNFSRMTLSLKKKKPRNFLMLFHSRGLRVDRGVFEDDLLQELLFKFLIYFYVPDKIPARKLLFHQGFTFRIMGEELDNLYSPPYLMHRHDYNLNTAGAQLWARSAAFAIKKFKQDAVRDDDDN